MMRAVVLTAADLRRLELRALCTGLLAAAAIALWMPERNTSVAHLPAGVVDRVIWQLGEHLCRANDGVASVTAFPPPREREYIYVCRDGMRTDTIRASLERTH